MQSLDNLLIKEYESITYKIDDIDAELEVLPTGSLQTKIISGRAYSYLQHREGRKIKTKYVPEGEAEELSKKIEKRNTISKERTRLLSDQRKIERALGKAIYELPVFSGYKPVKNVDYDSYTLFISSVSHDLKRLGKNGFIREYSDRKLSGINARYLKATLNLLNGEMGEQRNSSYLVLDPYTYQVYFTYKDKKVLKESLKNAIPQFLRQGLLVTEFKKVGEEPSYGKNK